MQNMFNQGLMSTMTNMLNQPQTNMPNQSQLNVSETEIETDDKKKKKQNAQQGTKPKSKPEYDFNSEMMGLYSKPLKFDNNQNSLQIANNVSKQMGLSPELLYSSAYIEGMNKAIANQDDVSEAYNEAYDSGQLNDDDLDKFPVDGFLNYGVDTFGNNYEKLKKFLPEGFEKRFKIYKAEQELTKADIKAGRKKGKIVNTAAFMTNQDALTAKAAMLKMEQENVMQSAKNLGLQLDPDAMDYFTMASYNVGPAGMKKMMEEYSRAKDKKSFIEKGGTSYKEVHTNVDRRMRMRKAINNLNAQKKP